MPEQGIEGFPLGPFGGAIEFFLHFFLLDPVFFSLYTLLIKKQISS